MGCDYIWTGHVAPGAPLEATLEFLRGARFWPRTVELADPDAAVLRVRRDRGTHRRLQLIESGLLVRGLGQGIPTEADPLLPWGQVLFDVRRGGRCVSLVPLHSPRDHWRCDIDSALADLADPPAPSRPDWAVLDRGWIRGGSVWTLPLYFLAIRQRWAPDLCFSDDYAITERVQERIDALGLSAALADPTVSRQELEAAWQDKLAGKRLARRWRTRRLVRAAPGRVIPLRGAR